MDFLKENIWLLLFVIWGIPLGFYRSKFRKLVYQTESWVINIKPVFIKEVKALFRNNYPENTQYVRFRKFYFIYLIVYSVLFLLYLGFNNKNAIEPGDKVPSFQLYNQDGEIFNLDTVLGKKNLVIYFYPKDDSPGCTKEACSFRDQYAVFNNADALVIGISKQSVKSHKEFALKYRLNYTLLSDPDNSVRKLFGADGSIFGLIPGRVTYIINKNGEIVYIFNSQIQATKHVEEAVRILKKLK